VERRTHPAVDEALQTHGYVIVDENGNVAAPQKASREAVLLWKSAAGWAGERARSAWQARPVTGTVVKLAGVLSALAISAVLVGVQLSTRVDRRVVLRDADAPTQTAMVASPPTIAAAPPALVAAPPEPGSVALALADQPPAPAEPLMRRSPAAAPPNAKPQPSTRSRAQASRPAAASVTTSARASAPARPAPTVVLETDPQGKGNQRSITYTASVLDASGHPLMNAEVSLLGWMPDGRDLKAPLDSTSTPGTYRGSVEVGVSTPGNLRVRVAHGDKSFDIAPQRRQH
jgi:hypothetical protein